MNPSHDKTRRLAALVLLFCTASLHAQETPVLTATDKGIRIEAGAAGKFTLPVPGLRLNDQDHSGEKAVVDFNGTDTLTAKYPSGAQLTMTTAGNAVECTFTGVPEGARGFSFPTQIPIKFANGGRFAIGKNALELFPEEKGKQLAGQGTAAEFTLVDPMDSGFRMVTPLDYQQVQDNRVFGWAVFMHIYNYTFKSHGGKTAFSFRFEPLEGVTPTAVAAATEIAPTAPNAPAPALSATDKGVRITSGAGTLTLPVPKLLLAEKDYEGEKAAVEMDGETIVARYPSGAEIRLVVSDEKKTVQGTYTGIPPGSKGFQFLTEIPINFNAGGRFAIGTQPFVNFPEEKGKQIVKDGGAATFTVIDPVGEGFKVTVPGNYHQVQDNRVFGWPVFMHIYTVMFQTQGNNKFTFTYSGLGDQTADPQTPAAQTGKSSETRKFQVDRYGQSARKEYPGKVKSDEELKADGIKQLGELAALQPDPTFDRFGGLAGSGEKFNLKKTGFFRADKAEGRHVLVTPEGNAFFQLSACGITNTDDYTTVKGREKVYEWIPPQDEMFKGAWRPNTPGAASFYIANWIRKFGKPYDKEEWAAQAVSRLRSWGFNSAGAFSGNPKTFQDTNFPNVGFLPLGAGDGVVVLPDKVGAQPLLDPFVPGTEAALDKRFAEKIAPRANDPLLIGYFLGNEQHFELLPKLAPSYKASKVAAKARLVEMLTEKYGGDIAKFNTSWNPAKPFASFEEIKEEPLFIRTETGAADMKKFYELYLETYFSMVERVFRKHDPNHLLIGSRLTPGTANNEPAVRIGSKYTDVNSINYYTYAIEESFLKKFHEWSGDKPIIFSEWYYASTEHGLNGGKLVKNQNERAQGYRNYIEQAAALPFVVGSQWFIYMDQSITGRFFEGFNGEGANTGLVDVTDRPYQELVDAAKTTNARIYDVMFGKEKPFAFADPRFSGKSAGGNREVSIPKALPEMKMDGTTTNWPGRPAEPIESSRLVLGNPNPNLRGDFRLCWDEENLYFLIQVQDSTPLKTNKDGKTLWGADGVELFIGAKDLNQPGNMIFSDRQILIGASETPKLHIVEHEEDARACQSLVVKDVTGDGYVLQTVIPWKVLGITPKPGQELLFDVAIDNSDDGDFRLQQLAWNGTAKNSNDRAGWGRAKLIEN